MTMIAERGIEAGTEWLRRQGHRVLVSESACWYDAAPGVYQAFPYHPVIDPPEEEIRHVLRETGARGLRYSAPPNSPVGKLSYHVVYSRPDYGFEQISRQARQNIRKGLDYARYEPVPFARMAEEGWIVRTETLARQGRLKAENKAWWKKLCLSADGLPGFEAWGAIHDGTLVAAMIAYLARDCYLMLYQQSRTEHLKHGVNNALGFVVSQRTAARPEVKQLFYGLQSLDAASDVDEFKFRMGYAAVPVRQRVCFHPALRPIVRPATLAAVDFVVRIGGGRPAWLKAAGMMRFYLDGNRPLSQQECPDCLAAWREEHLKKAS